jgi:Glycosyl hydrolase family 1
MESISEVGVVVQPPAATETSALLPRSDDAREETDDNGDNDDDEDEKSTSLVLECSAYALLMVLSAVSAFFLASAYKRFEAHGEPFPSSFVFGVATSSYQIEGGATSRGGTIWDTFANTPGAILDNSTAIVADDHYHLWEQDVMLMRGLNVQAYRFSIAWSRILPQGRGEISREGIRFYDQLIDALLVNGIEPWVTLFHWDLPQPLEDEFGGWLDARIVYAFEDYARVIFETFGHKVKHFITLNEPWT